MAICGSTVVLLSSVLYILVIHNFFVQVVSFFPNEIYTSMPSDIYYFLNGSISDRLLELYSTCAAMVHPSLLIVDGLMLFYILFNDLDFDNNYFMD